MRVARHPVVIDERDARTEGPDILVGRLHELSACGVDRIGEVAFSILLGASNVEDEKRPLVPFAPPGVEGRRVHVLHAKAIGKPIGRPCRPLTPRVAARRAADRPGRARARSPRDASPWFRFEARSPGFGMPALMRPWAPMMLRVRPAQFTTTSVSESGAASPTRCTSSTPGQQTPLGMFIAWNSSIGRLSSTTRGSPRSIIAFSSSAETEGVSNSCSMNSPNALLGTLMPLNAV